VGSFAKNYRFALLLLAGFFYACPSAANFRCVTAVVQQGGDRYTVVSTERWLDLFYQIRRGGLMPSEVPFLSISRSHLKELGWEPAQWDLMRSQLHRSVSGMLHDLVLSTISRAVGKRAGEFLPKGDLSYSQVAAEAYFLSQVGGPASETYRTPEWWGDRLFGALPSFRFIFENSDFTSGPRHNHEVQLARSLLLGLERIDPYLRGASFEGALNNSLSAVGAYRSPRSGSVRDYQWEETLEETEQVITIQNRTLTLQHIRSQTVNDPILLVPMHHLPRSELAHFGPYVLAHVMMEDQQIGSVLSLGDVQGPKLHETLSEIREMIRTHLNSNFP